MRRCRRDRTPARPVASPGHQAGAPLRQFADQPRLFGVRPSPGHQAGAPLRRSSMPTTRRWVASFPRPSGRGSIAARCDRRPDRHADPAFPRPSGRGSIAAVLTRSNALAAGRLPPAIRPGLHCGAAGGESVAVELGTSPGHQAGAPLRQRQPRRPALHVAASPGHQAGAPLRLGLD